jgi:GTP pyrophosphokinase
MMRRKAIQVCITLQIRRNTEEGLADNWLNLLKKRKFKPARRFCRRFQNESAQKKSMFYSKEDIKSLPKEQPPLDFAFSIHSEIGSARGTKLNGVPTVHMRKMVMG